MQKSTLSEMRQKMKGFLITEKSQDQSINQDQFFELFDELPETLSQSAHYSIKLVQEKKTQKIFTCKLIYLSDLELQMAVRQEYKNLQTVQGHPNIIQCFEKFENEHRGQIRIIFEHLEGYQSLQNILATAVCSEEQIRKIISQVLQALSFLHSKFIAHRNISPSTILVNKDFQVKITDFTVSKNYLQILGENNEPRTMLTPLGQTVYSSPDVISLLDFGYTEKVDIWPLGIITIEALCQQKPFKKISKFQIKQFKDFFSLDKLQKTIILFFEQNESKLQADLIILLKGFLSIDLNQRISAAKALENAWIQKSGSFI